MQHNAVCCRIPSELIHKVLSRVIANSVHTICMSPQTPHWELDIVSTLCTVSSTFRAITVEVLAKAFTVSQSEAGDPTTVIPFARQKLAYLRDLGEQSREKYNRNSSLIPVPNDDPRLMHGYSLYVTAMALRRNAAQTSGDLFKATHDAVLKALSIVSNVCSLVSPAGMAAVLMEAVEEETFLVQSGLTFFRIQKELEILTQNVLDEEAAEDEDKALRLNHIRTNIHRVLQTTEKVVEKYRQFLAVEASRTDTVPHQTLELKGVLESVKKYKYLHFNVDEYEISTRATSLTHELDALVSK